MGGDGRPTDRAALMALALLGSILANVLLLSQLFVWRPEYVAELRNINARLARIEARIGIDGADSGEPERGEAAPR